MTTTLFRQRLGEPFWGRLVQILGTEDLAQVFMACVLYQFCPDVTLADACEKSGLSEDAFIAALHFYKVPPRR